MDVDALLAEQRAYYRARASEYDEWWQRRGRFDQGTELFEEWDRQVSQVAAALDAFGAIGKSWNSPEAPAGGRSDSPEPPIT